MLVGLLWVLFVVSALALSLLILIQEGRGGGIAEAFGGMGQETFGSGARGVNKVTAGLAAVFLVSAILINKVSQSTPTLDVQDAPPASSTDAGSGENKGG
ncbi:MAG: preprotein translocase subunit SecG [Planctomycetes bacterium]|nr:preprotein translocase subunit SecG [Planctomycetota bacterium]